MALGRLFVLILLRVLFVHGEIYLYNNTTILFMFDDYLSEDGPGIPFQGFEVMDFLQFYLSCIFKKEKISFEIIDRDNIVFF